MTGMTGMTESPATLDALLESMTPEIHARLKEAVALGRWENGDKLSEAQKSLCLQAVIAYDEKYLTPEQRVGYIRKRQCHD